VLDAVILGAGVRECSVEFNHGLKFQRLLEVRCG
jgi:hypothetical protein